MDLTLRMGQENENNKMPFIAEQQRSSFRQDFKRPPVHSGEYKRSNVNDFNFGKTKAPSLQLIADSVWKGSLSSLVSTENLTEGLLKEAVQQLEKGLQDSQALLSQRDKEIEKLRQELETSKQAVHVDLSKQEELLNELEESQKKVIELEDQISKLKRQLADNVRKVAELRESDPDENGEFPECTCYCGSVCRALREVNDVKKQLETVERKYANLKQKIRERRKQAEAAQNRSSLRVTVSERAPGCVLQ